MLSARSFSKRATRKVLIDIPGKADISPTEDKENVHDPIHWCIESGSRLLGGAKRGRGRPRHNVGRASPPVRLPKTDWKLANSSDPIH
jgi:hypothetical protein